MKKMRIDEGETYTEVSIEGGPCVQIRTNKGTVLIGRVDWFLMVEFVAQNLKPRPENKTT